MGKPAKDESDKLWESIISEARDAARNQNYAADDFSGIAQFSLGWVASALVASLLDDKWRKSYLKQLREWTPHV